MTRLRTRSALVVAVLAATALAAAACTDDEAFLSTSTTSPVVGELEQQAAGDGDGAPELDAALVDEMTTVIGATVDELGVPGAVVLVRTPTGDWETTVGVGDLGTEEPLEPGLRWPIRSITKSFTTTLVLQLADEGVLSVDDPVSDWVEGVPNGDEITLRQLMDMTSGLADYTTQAFIDDFVADPQREFTTEELIAYSTAEEPVAEPGAERVYTNANTLLLGAVVEAATGQPFDEVLTERILEPLGLDGTVYPTSTEDWTSDTVGYAPGDDGLEAEPVNFSVFGPAGAMTSTTADLAAWGEALATGALLDDGTQAGRLEGGVLEEGPEYDLYAAGIGDLDGWWGHTGEGFGYTALVMHDVDRDTTVVIAMNASQLADGHGPTVLFRRLAPLLSDG